MDGVGPGSYSAVEAFDKNCKPREYPSTAKATSQRVSFTDGYAKLTQKNPAVGVYKDVDRGFKLMNKPTFDAIK